MVSWYNCRTNCWARNPNTGNKCLCFLRAGQGGGPVPVMEWYPIQGGKQYNDWVLDVEKRVHWPEKSPELQCKVS